MPLTRYQIRNEYSLADPELYRAADKEDPEALLEGVAMAGLVGVLRQLGDLAEFAAEIFHDLHEELMATAARGHGLTIRVQQIEAEFPSIEKAFLSQTNHSSFFYNAGVEWHPNVHMDQNLVTRGDLPRFVMDSYEECRGPPRLFLLDKFDVAGAGSCLKRYTDPSFFKARSPLSAMPNSEVQREKKSRKSKKKGSRWRNGETPEVLSTSHVKLQQLFLEERVENHISDPACRVKLKRRVNGSPFDSAMRKSYMDAFLKVPTPDPDVLEIPITSSSLKMPSSVAGEAGNEVLDIIVISPDRNTQRRKRSTYSSSDSEAGHKPSIHELTEEGYGISPKFGSPQMEDVPSTLHEVDKKEIVAEGTRKIEGYQSDDEVDNYVDALTTMDSEMETDSDYRAKNDMCVLNVDGQRMGSDATEELYDSQTHSTDSQSMGNSSLMDGGNISSGKGKSSFSYSGSFDLAENAPSEGDASSKPIPSAEHCESEIVNSSSDLYPFNGNTASSQAPRSPIQDNVCNENANTSSYKTEFGEPSSSSCLTSTVLLPGEHFTEVSSLGQESDELSSNHSNSKFGYVNDEENLIHLDKNTSCMSNYNDLPSQIGEVGFSKLSFKSMDELKYHDKHEFDALHLPSVLQLASNNDSNEGLGNDMMGGEYLEKEHGLSSVQSPAAFSSHKEMFDEQEKESCGPPVKPEGNASEETTSRYCPIFDSLETAELVEKQLRKPENDHSLDPGVGFSHIQEAKLDETSSSVANGEEMGGLSSNSDLVQKDHDAINLASEVQSFLDSPRAAVVSLDDEIVDTIHLQANDVANSVADTNFDDNGSDASSSDRRSMKLPEECSLGLQDLNQNGMEVNVEYHHEGSMEEMANGQADVSSELESISSKKLPCDYSDFDLLHVSDLSTAASLHVDKDNAVTPCHDPEDAEAKALPKMSVIDKEDVQSSPTHHLVEASNVLDQQAKLYNGQFDVESWHDLVSESVVVEGIEDVSSSPTNHFAEFSTAFNQNVESQNDDLDVKSCHGTQDQVPESKYSHQTDAMEEEEEEISSPTHHVAELRIPLEENLEHPEYQFDLESRYDQVLESNSAQHINVKNDEDLISSPTHHKAGLRASLEQKDESASDIADQPCQGEGSDSESVQQISASEIAEDAVSPFSHCTTELQPPTERKVEFQNKQFDVKSWHENLELEHAQQIEVTENSETAVSLDTHCIGELTTSIDQTVELQDHFDESSGPTVNGNTDPLSLMQQGEPTPSDLEREIDPSSEFSALHLLSQQSSQFIPQFSVSKPGENQLGSNFPTFGFFPEASLDEMPPLPPLPPIQWRLGKVQHTFPAPERNLLEHNLPSIPSLISATEDKSQSGHPSREAGIGSPSNLSSRHSSFEDNNSQDKHENPVGYVVHFADPSSQQVPDLVTSASRMQVVTPGLVLPMDESVRCEDVSLDSNRGKFQHSVDPSFPLTSVEDTPSTLPFCYSSGKPVEPLNQSVPSTSSRLDDNIGGEAIVSEEKTVNLPTTVISLPVTQEYEKQPVLSTSGEQVTWNLSSSIPFVPSEDGMPNGNRQIKLPRPRNPLIDAVVAHDKSKLKKVTQLPQSQIGQKVEERDSLLEQIRAKSFNLKPAVVTRPSIQGPKTNLKLAAILEKANAIRQAFAGTGSDEDKDEDGWSDS